MCTNQFNKPKQTSMKNYIFLLIIIFSSIQLKSQDLNNLSEVIKTDYLQKSKNQNTIGWVLLGGGAAAVVMGGTWHTGESNSDQIYTDNFDTQAFLILGGAVSALASIPFFISARHNKEKAKKVSLKIKIESLNCKYLKPNYGNIHSISFVIPIRK